MNWDAVGAIGEVLGAVGVVATLGYLAAQIRQNSKVVRSATRQAISTAQADFGVQIVSNPEMRASSSRWIDHAPPNSSLEETFRNDVFIRSLLRMYENQYHQYIDGTFDTAMWSGYLENMRRSFAGPTFRDWWRTNDKLYSTDFAAFVNAELQSRFRDPDVD